MKRKKTNRTSGGLCLVAGVCLVQAFAGVSQGEDDMARFTIRVELTEREGFATFTNASHPGNRIGYRFHEHTPIVHGTIPKDEREAGLDPGEIDWLIARMADRPGMVRHTLQIHDEKWAPQSWTFYLAPCNDGIDLLWVVDAGERGLPEYHGVQQCFRMSGTTNEPWRREIAETPAFSEYDHWSKLQGDDKPKSSLTYVQRAGNWQPLPPVEPSVGARTPLGMRVDVLRSEGQLEQMPTVGPYRAQMLAPIDRGLIARTDKDQTWVCGIYWDRTSHVTDHHPADCLHSIVNLGPIPAHGRRAVRGKIYWFAGSLDDLAVQWQRDFSDRGFRLQPARTPAWVNAIPDRLGDILVEKHLCPNAEVWGLAKRMPDQELPYDEIGSSTLLGLVKKYDLFDRVGPLDEEARKKALAFWQGWQDPETGRFKDPRDPERVVNEKYVVGTIHALGGELLYPWTTTGQSKTIETDTFLRRTREDPDWADGGWGVGSHTGLMAVEIYDAINAGQTELIDDLERGIMQILSHQNPDGLWGPTNARTAGRIGGTLKVIGRFYYRMGLEVPHTRELADSLIARQRSGEWYRAGHDSCVPRNVAEIVAYCLDVSDYRRTELLGVLEALAEEYTEWVNPDGTLLTHRGQREKAGLQYTTMYGLGILGGYLNWQDCRLPNPLAGRRCGTETRYRPILLPDGTVQVIDTRAQHETSSPPAASR